jgi:hypothetical protein
MKVKVNRELNGGKYHVNFEVGDFTPDELAKMSSFGIPIINLVWTAAQGGLISSGLPMTKVGKIYDAGFDTEQMAQEYVDDVVKQLRVAIQRLRESKDDFSSSQEVEL